jgi:hypothetical protein
VGEPDGKRSRPRHRWVDNIKMDLAMTGWGSVDWIGPGQVSYRWNAVTNLRVS